MWVLFQPLFWSTASFQNEKVLLKSFYFSYVQLLLWQDEVSQPVFNGVALKRLLPFNSCCHSLAWSLLSGQLRGQSGRATGAPTASLRILPTNVRSKGQAHENYCLLFMNYFPEIGSLAESKCWLARIARALLTEYAHLGTPFFWSQKIFCFCSLWDFYII